MTARLILLPAVLTAVALLAAGLVVRLVSPATVAGACLLFVAVFAAVCAVELAVIGRVLNRKESRRG